MAAMLKDYVKLSHIDSFKAAWDLCDNKTILKHLDNQVTLIPGLREQDLNGVWGRAHRPLLRWQLHRGHLRRVAQLEKPAERLQHQRLHVIPLSSGRMSQVAGG